MVCPRGVSRGVKSIDDSKFKTHFEEPYALLGPFPFWMAPGNHDHRHSGSVDAQVAYGRSGRSQRWRMPAAYYAVEGLPNWLHIYSLDTELISEGAANHEQAEQARAVLCGKPGWRLLMGHHLSVQRDGGRARVRAALATRARSRAVQPPAHSNQLFISSSSRSVKPPAARCRRNTFNA
jgi:hypothetical protein